MADASARRLSPTSISSRRRWRAALERRSLDPGRARVQVGDGARRHRDLHRCEPGRAGATLLLSPTTGNDDHRLNRQTGRDNGTHHRRDRDQHTDTAVRRGPSSGTTEERPERTECVSTCGLRGKGGTYKKKTQIKTK